MSTKKDSEQEMGRSDEGLVPMDSEDKGTSRRKFTRNVLLGSAVLLTLGNRSAWGATPTCISTNLLVSLGTGQASINTAQQDAIDQYYENYPANPNDVIEYEDNGNTCWELVEPVSEQEPTTFFTFGSSGRRRR